MDRRDALRALGAGIAPPLVGCLSDPPDRTGPRNAPNSPEGGPPGGTADGGDPVRISSYDFEETDDGRLRVFGTVVNDGDAERRVTVVARVTTPDDEHERSTELSVPPGEAAEFAVEFAVEFDAFAKDGTVVVRLA